MRAGTPFKYIRICMYNVLHMHCFSMVYKSHMSLNSDLALKATGACILDVLWGQPIKLIQVVSTSEFHEY